MEFINSEKYKALFAQFLCLDFLKPKAESEDPLILVKMYFLDNFAMYLVRYCTGLMYGDSIIRKCQGNSKFDSIDKWKMKSDILDEILSIIKK